MNRHVYAIAGRQSLRLSQLQSLSQKKVSGTIRTLLCDTISMRD
jgi:hypothetical protein